MSDFLNGFLFGVYPYIALTFLALGSVIRYDREPYTWRSGSTQLLRRRELVWGSILFHVGILIIFLGHLIGLLTPVEVFHALGVGNSTKQVMAIIVGGVAGVVSLIGGGLLLHRRMYDPRIRRTSAWGDIWILILLEVQLVFGIAGIFVSLQHIEGGEMLKFMAWAQGIFTFNPGAWMYVADAHWIFKVHLFLGLTIFLVFPFTRLVHILSVPVRYLWRPAYQLVRTRSVPTSTE